MIKQLNDKYKFVLIKAFQQFVIMIIIITKGICFFKVKCTAETKSHGYHCCFDSSGPLK